MPPLGSLAGRSHGTRGFGWLEPCNGFTWQAHRVTLLDQAEMRFGPRTDKAHGHAPFTGASGAANAMDVVHRRAGQVVVHDGRQLVDMDAPRGDVSRNEHLQCDCLEVREGFGTGGLAQFAMQRGGLDAFPPQLVGDVLGRVLAWRRTPGRGTS